MSQNMRYIPDTGRDRMKAWVLLLMVLAAWLLPCAALGEGAAMAQARLRLQALDIAVSDALAGEVEQAQAAMAQHMARTGMRAEETTPGSTVYDLLIFMGCGDYSQDTGEWMPTSDRVYAFDAEVYDIEHMYTRFLLGMQAIIPGIAITDVREDLSGMAEDMNFSGVDGTRSVDFCVNEHPYSVTLESRGDWFNEEMIAFFMDVLEREQYPGKLHQITDSMDQMVILFYGSDADALRLRLALQ